MKEFTYSYPTRVYFGEGTAAKSLEKELVHIRYVCLWGRFNKEKRDLQRA